MKQKCFEIPFPIFGVSVHVAVGDGYDKLPEEMHDGFAYKNYFGRTHCLIQTEKPWIAMHLKKRMAGVIAHESVHATNMILDHIGAGPFLLDDEVQAYLVEYLVSSIWEYSK